jgi:hypothetical protein
MCNLTCSTTLGPFSPIRQGSANNIYVVPAPERITFGTGTILGAACCIPAVLHLISMRSKIRRVNWYAVFGAKNKAKMAPSQGTDSATVSIKKFPIIPEVLVFGLAVVFVLVLGEMNFFTRQVSWQKEPMSAIGKQSFSFILIRWLTIFVPCAGQWAPILGTVLAVVGLLYHITYGKNKSSASPHDVATGGAINERLSLSHSGGRTSTEGVIGSSRLVTPTGGNPPPERVPTIKPLQRVVTLGGIGTQKLAKTLTSLSERLGAPTPDQYGDSAYSSRLEQHYPETPGEASRNPNFNKTEHQWIRNIKQNSRAPSFTGSTNSGPRPTVGSNTPSRGQSPRRSHSDTPPAERASGELQPVASHPSAGSNGEMLQRQTTLQVPDLGRQGRRLSLSASLSTSDDSINQGMGSPAVIISHDPQELDPDVPDGT